MEKRKLVDTSVLVALFIGADSQHAKARRTIVSGMHFFVLDVVVYETVTVLNRLSGYEQAAAFVTFVRENSGVTIVATSQNSDKYLDTFVSTMSGALSLIDVALLWHSGQYDVVTFDKDLAKAIARNK